MSHTLTEADSYPATITVPDGTDPGAFRTDDVETLAQGLANRTHNLNLHAAKFDEAKTWTQGQLFQILAAGTSMLKSIAAANDDTSSPANIWKEQFAFKLNDGGQYVRFYSGSGNGSFGNWAITSNAKWNEAPSPSPGQTWSKDNDAYESNVLRCFNGELHWYGKAPGAGVWAPTAWDTNRGNMLVGDTLSANTIHAFGNFRADLEYLYHSPPTRTIVLPYQLADRTSGVSLTTVPGSLTLAPNSRVEFPLRLPAGATLGTCKVCVATPGASADWAIDISKQTPNFSTGVFGSPAAVGTGSSGTVTSGSTPDVATANGGGATIAGDSSYWITIGCPNTSANDLQISGVEVSFVDPGPRNY